MSSWSSQASKHLEKLRSAIDQVFKTNHLVQLRQEGTQSVLTGAAKQAVIIFMGEQTYLRDIPEGMSLMTLLTAITDGKRVGLPGRNQPCSI